MTRPNPVVVENFELLQSLEYSPVHGWLHYGNWLEHWCPVLWQCAIQQAPMGPAADPLYFALLRANHSTAAQQTRIALLHELTPDPAGFSIVERLDSLYRQRPRPKFRQYTLDFFRIGK